jgi:4-diphosphocytidyl-2-methyl-D-erithritol synthase
MNIALLTAAGFGTRMHMETPKQFINVAGKPIIIYTLEVFQKHPAIDAIIIATIPEWQENVWAYARKFGIEKLRWIVPGGKTGQDSILNALCELKRQCFSNDIVIIHDGNRPMVSEEMISDSLSVYQRHGSAVAAIPCIEAVFHSNDGESSEISIPRDKLFRTQTPHTYSLEKLLWAHEQAKEHGIENSIATCTLMNALGETIYFSKGSEKNIKITRQDDLDIFKAFLNSNSNH